MNCGGLDAADLNRPHPPSTMTLGGLLKHMALVEERYTIDFTGEARGPPLDVADTAADPDWAWRTAADDTPEKPSGDFQYWHGEVMVRSAELPDRARASDSGALADGPSTASPPAPAPSDQPARALSR